MTDLMAEKPSAEAAEDAEAAVAVEGAEDAEAAVAVEGAEASETFETEEPARSLRARLTAAGRSAAPAIGLYLGLRLISLDLLAVLVMLGHRREPRRMVYWDGSTDTWRGYRAITDVLLSWDGRWYSLIADRGYENLSAGGVDEHGIPYTHRLAFFPLYPYLAKPLTWIPGVSAGTACLLVSAIASIFAAWGLYAIGRHIRGHKLGIMLAALWAVAPASMTQHGAFTESLFTAFSVWALYAVIKRRWVTAGVITAVAGLTRPTAIALVVTVCLAAVWAAGLQRDRWRPYFALLAAPVGYLGWILFAGRYLGGPGGFFSLQRMFWDSYFDFGKTSLENIANVVFLQSNYKESVFFVTVVTVVVVALGSVLAAIHRVPWVLVLFAAVMFAGSVGSHANFSALTRHLLPVFPALIVPAIALTRARLRTVCVVLPALAGLSAWYAGWLPFISGQVI